MAIPLAALPPEEQPALSNAWKAGIDVARGLIANLNKVCGELVSTFRNYQSLQAALGDPAVGTQAQRLRSELRRLRAQP